MTTTAPIVRVDLELGTYDPVVDDDDDWKPIRYAVHAHHATRLTADATKVVERTIERLTLVRTNNDPDVFDAPPLVELELPETAQGIEALISLLDHARDYLEEQQR